jgi:methylated-DNA-[protein]-cysteine S-methyltransferase
MRPTQAGEPEVGAAVRCRAGWLALARSPAGIASVRLPFARRGEAVEALAGVRCIEADRDDLLARAASELAAYFEGERVAFLLPIDLQTATPFRRRVLGRVVQVPYGEVVSYGQVARSIGSPGAARAVGQAMAANPVPILVPCHRVIGSGGGLTGFGGGLALKAALLALEREGRLVPWPRDRC